MASPYFPEHAGEAEASDRVVKARFSAQSYQVVTQLADATHVTRDAVMRDALSVYWWLARERSAGSRFLVQRGEWVTELMLPSLEGMDPLAEENEGAPADQRAPTNRPMGEASNGHAERPWGDIA